jgi:hypothetical protein
MSNVTLIRLNSGEEILTRVIDSTNGYTIKDPALIVPMGQGRIGLAPWLPYAETDNMYLPADAVMFTITPKPEMTKNYIEATSNLVLPDNEVKGTPSGLKLVTE